MAVDVTKVSHEPMFIVYNATELGFVEAGNVTVSFKEEWVEQGAHQLGGRVIERYYKPGNPTIQFKLLQVLDKTLWDEVFPLGSLQSNGAAGTRFSPTLITAGASTAHAGQKATGIAQELILRPARLYAAAATETVDDIVFPKAHCMNVGNMDFGVDAAFAFDVTFGTLYVPAATEGEHIWYYGLKTGSWVDA